MSIHRYAYYRKMHARIHTHTHKHIHTSTQKKHKHSCTHTHANTPTHKRPPNTGTRKERERRGKQNTSDGALTSCIPPSSCDSSEDGTLAPISRRIRRRCLSVASSILALPSCPLSSSYIPVINQKTQKKKKKKKKKEKNTCTGTPWRKYPQDWLSLWIPSRCRHTVGTGVCLSTLSWCLSCAAGILTACLRGVFMCAERNVMRHTWTHWWREGCEGESHRASIHLHDCEWIWSPCVLLWTTHNRPTLDNTQPPPAVMTTGIHSSPRTTDRDTQESRDILLESCETTATPSAAPES